MHTYRGVSWTQYSGVLYNTAESSKRIHKIRQLYWNRQLTEFIQVSRRTWKKNTGVALIVKFSLAISLQTSSSWVYHDQHTQISKCKWSNDSVHYQVRSALKNTFTAQMFGFGTFSTTEKRTPHKLSLFDNGEYFSLLVASDLSKN